MQPVVACLVIFVATIAISQAAPHKTSSALYLHKQLQQLNRNPVDGFSAGLVDESNIYKWEVLIMGPPDTLYEGGFFKAYLDFPKDYPLNPPTMRFISEMWHPNIYRNGNVCIDILQSAWSPVQTVETILISIASMFMDPNNASPANPEAANQWANNKAEFKKQVKRTVRNSQED